MPLQLIFLIIKEVVQNCRLYKVGLSVLCQANQTSDLLDLGLHGVDGVPPALSDDLPDDHLFPRLDVEQEEVRADVGLFENVQLLPVLPGRRRGS